MESVNFRKLEESDISTIEKWLYKEHVIRWYKEPLEWLDEISKRDSEYDWITHYIVEVDYLGKGYGRDIAQKLAEVIMNDTNAKTIIVQPEPENVASRKTLLSAGYSYDKENDVYYIVR